MTQQISGIKQILEHRNFVIFEFLALFVIVPLVAWMEIFRIGIFAYFSIPVFYGLFIYLFLGYTRSGIRLRIVPIVQAIKAVPFFRIGAISALIFLIAYIFVPDRFLILPKTRPELWVIILFGYPLISAMPQEFLYRVFFFKRYQTIFPQTNLMIWSNTVCFSFLHFMYDNWVAPTLTLIGGFLFASSWNKHKNFLSIWIEHAAYGLSLFTSGLGQYFYENMAR